MVSILETIKKAARSANRTIRLQAVALQYAVIVSFVVFLISGLFLLLYFHNSIIVDKAILCDEMEAAVNSAISRCIAQPTNQFGTQTIVLNENTVSVSVTPVGMYSLVRAWCQRGSERYNNAAMIGYDYSPQTMPTLWLANDEKFLQVSGKNLIHGTCYLPTYGIRPGMYLNRGFVGEKIVNGQVKISKQNMPPVPPQITDYANKLLHCALDSACVVRSDTLRLNDSLVGSYWQKPLLIKFDAPASLPRCSLVGNIVLWSPFPIVIPAQAHLSNVVVVAPQVSVQPGFCGSVHIVSSKNIHLAKQTKLLLPSTLCVVAQQQNTDSAQIWIDSSATVAGAVVAIGVAPYNKPSCIYIAAGAQVHGLVYSAMHVELRGRVFGAVFCNLFTIRSYEGIYQNMLYESEIDITKLHPSFAGPAWGEFTTRKKLLKYVY